MNTNAPANAPELTVIAGRTPLAESAAEYDPEMVEILEAKRHFDDPMDPELYWAGRLLADRKSTRIAA